MSPLRDTDEPRTRCGSIEAGCSYCRFRSHETYYRWIRTVLGSNWRRQSFSADGTDLMTLSYS